MVLCPDDLGRGDGTLAFPLTPFLHPARWPLVRAARSVGGGGERGGRGAWEVDVA